ncbi:MAG: DUF4430 domain-containing protein [Clostridia bacterium]|nr:DUF4430 domain-containing protein [Clostridia bacterium]
MKKDLLIALAVILALAVFLGGSEILSVDEYYLIHIDDVRADSETVTVSIDCTSILSHLDDLDPALRDYLPENGMLLSPAVYVLREGDTAFDMLSRAVRHNRIQMDYQGADKTGFGAVYVVGVGYFYEFSCGPHSGWTYRVNGVYPTVGSSKYVLQNGDTLEWVYSCTLDEIG